ncbi:MAG: helix-turn-helix domain-containing protein [Euryarchaeota archaeon]|nr:helix-turn-helix domain-containing protein [Euryarchaeota archaeon]
MRADELLDILGNRTRREIIRRVSEEPKCLSELSREMGVEKMALARHLDSMRKANILTVEEERIKRGRPRKYYEIAEHISLRVDISPEEFSMKLRTPSQETDRDSVHTLRLESAKAINDPLQRLAALTKIAEDVKKEIEYYEDALQRAEDVLDQVRRAGREAVKELRLTRSERSSLLKVVGLGKRSKLESIIET